jgi:hypothetical protein
VHFIRLWRKPKRTITQLTTLYAGLIFGEYYITKYSSNKFILFVVYDPDREIPQDDLFRKDIESKRDCLVCIIR